MRIITQIDGASLKSDVEIPDAIVLLQAVGEKEQRGQIFVKHTPKCYAQYVVEGNATSEKDLEEYIENYRNVITEAQVILDEQMKARKETEENEARPKKS